ncbi:MAG: glycosyltransferase family 4 protein [Actinomycetota bacterium]|nr:glycosyltransferase family 4 protein [Actinomycetota bacterium]
MRVLLVSANFRPHVGGIERFTENLAMGLAQRGHEVKVVCCRHDDAPPYEELDGFVVDRVRCGYMLDRRFNVPYPVPDPVRLLTTLRSAVAESDVVHVQDSIYATSLLALLVARRRGASSVLTQHVAFVPQRTRLLDAVERTALATVGRCARLATVVAALNPAVAEWVEHQWGIRGVKVMPVGVPVANPTTRDRAKTRLSFGLPPEQFLALFVGRDVPKKGLDVFLGATDHAYELVAVTDRTDAGTAATVLPFMSAERLQELLSCVDCFVLPSEGEGFPLTLQEAFGQGLPVVTTSQPGYEYYLGPEDVLYVDRNAGAVREALRRLATDDELRRHLGERSANVAKRHFGIDRFVAAYEELYVYARGQ